MIDLSEINELTVDLQDAGIRAAIEVPKALLEIGEDIRDDARRFAPGAHGGRAKHYPKAITHELDGPLAVEIGPEKRGQGNLGHLFEYGIESRGIPPQAHLGPALDRNEPNAIEKLGEAAHRSILP